MDDAQLRLDGRSEATPPAQTGRIVSTEPAAADDPLTEAQARALLDPVDVIRDPLHGDVRLTALERTLIDTPEFQRLRGINQLAMTYVAYPGALHTRFLHSIGTLQVCSQMINTCQTNAEIYRRLANHGSPIPLKLSSYTILLARLCALLHDLAHVAFGHTLEKEGKIFDLDEWQDTHRRENLLLGPRTPLAETFRRFFSSCDLMPAAADAVREEIKGILSAKRQDVLNLRYPFIHDLVGNTICADLIDYVQRDMYFCGLNERFGLRFMEYLGVVRLAHQLESDGDVFRPVASGKGEVFPRAVGPNGAEMCRVVLLQYRYNERRVPVVKHDVIAESIDLVRRRLAVAEKLYFHRTKMVASAMLISSAFESNVSAMDLWNLTDEEVLKSLEKSQSERGAILARKLRTRRLFKPIYRASYHERDESPASHALWDEHTGAYRRFETPKAREELATRLERILGVVVHGAEEKGKGTVTISCPDARMNLKAFDMLVLPRPGATVRRLHDSTHPPTIKEIEAIIATHKHLWRLEVFVDPELVPPSPESPIAQRLAGAIQREIGPRNEVEGFGGAPAVDLGEWEHETLVEKQLKDVGVFDEIRAVDLAELKRSHYRNVDVDKRDEAIATFLREKGYIE